MYAANNLPEHDQKLIAEARRLPFGAIHPENAETEEGRSIMEDIAHREYRREERMSRME